MTTNLRQDENIDWVQCDKKNVEIRTKHMEGRLKERRSEMKFQLIDNLASTINSYDPIISTIIVEAVLSNSGTSFNEQPLKGHN